MLDKDELLHWCTRLNLCEEARNAIELVRPLKICWLGGRDSNPDSQIQSLVSYHWTTSQREEFQCKCRRFSLSN